VTGARGAGNARRGRGRSAGTHPLRIGLTGPIGCGKSTVAAWLGELGLRVVDADVVAREVVEPGTSGFDEVRATFGDDVVAPGGSLDRSALGQIVFSNPDALRRLEAIVHPAVRPRILRAIADADRDQARGVVIEAIKLVEGGLAELCDEVWLVTCHRDQQRARLRERGLDDANAERRIDAQADLVARAAGSATRTIDTSGSIEPTRALVEQAFMDARRRAEAAR
jgi:dephospho-CoA kinase